MSVKTAVLVLGIIFGCSSVILAAYMLQSFMFNRDFWSYNLGGMMYADLLTFLAIGVGLAGLICSIAGHGRSTPTAIAGVIVNIASIVLGIFAFLDFHFLYLL